MRHEKARALLPWVALTEEGAALLQTTRRARHQLSLLLSPGEVVRCQPFQHVALAWGSFDKRAFGGALEALWAKGTPPHYYCNIISST